MPPHARARGRRVRCPLTRHKARMLIGRFVQFAAMRHDGCRPNKSNQKQRTSNFDGNQMPAEQFGPQAGNVLRS